ncbi:MAG: hypothetical protein LWW97_07085 [Deltaproteobacteria bacterium]|nr:hypothetical protein [Deltaproteobacteria bacterium]
MSRIPAIIFFLICSLFVVTISYGQENTLKQSGKQELVLSQADQLILEAINKTNERIDNLSKELNGRIDTLWITMLGGFMGVMAFIGGIVFWDRRTFLKRAKEECRQEVIADRKTMEGMLAAIRKLSEKSPETRELLNNFGLL